MEVADILPSGKFTRPQLDLLRMFSANIPDEDWEAIREQIKHYFAQKAVEEMDKLFDEKGWGDGKIDELLNTHMRTPYKK